MNITYLIGNGFDLNLGLATKYSDFISTYVDQKSGNPAIDKFKSAVTKDLALWSDAELAFGKITSKFSNADEFCDCHENFCKELASYLKMQEARLHFDSLEELIPSIFVESIKSISKGFRKKQQEQIQECFDMASGGLTFNFIAFNYTKTLDKCVDFAKRTSLLGSRTHCGSTYNNNFGTVLHIHGFTDNNMVLGVNDRSQIKNLRLFEGMPKENIGQIIKRETNKIYEEDMDERCVKILNSSDLIYIYGMSIGETDAIWWRRICTLLKNKQNVRVIIHGFDAPIAELYRTKFIKYERDMKIKFVKYDNISNGLRTPIIKQIHVSDANIFSPMNNLVNHEKNIPKEHVGIAL